MNALNLVRKPRKGMKGNRPERKPRKPIAEADCVIPLMYPTQRDVEEVYEELTKYSCDRRLNQELY